LLSAFQQVVTRSHSEPPSILAQCNLMLCLYRRLYSLKWAIPGDIIAKALGVMQTGLRAVRMCIANGSPWHHVANIPFQSTCALLAIDSKESFALLGDASSCLDAVTQAYPTNATRDAADAARALIYMHRRRRETELSRQNELLQLYPVAIPTSDQVSANFDFSQAFNDLPWFSDLMPDVDFGAFGDILNV
jgi:hypothetical protein